MTANPSTLVLSTMRSVLLPRLMTIWRVSCPAGASTLVWANLISHAKTRSTLQRKDSCSPKKKKEDENPEIGHRGTCLKVEPQTNLPLAARQNLQIRAERRRGNVGKLFD